MFVGRQVAFVSDNKDQIECLNFYLTTQGLKTYCDGRIIAAWKPSYKQCLYKGAIFINDMELNEIKWVAKNGYVQHNMAGLVNAAKMENKNFLTKSDLKTLYSNPFLVNKTPQNQEELSQ